MTGGQRELRKQQTHDAIVAAAQALFDEVGYDETRTAEIARRAGVSEPTVFRHFTSKAAIALADFSALIDLLVDHFIAGLEAATPYEVTVAMLSSPPGEADHDDESRRAMGRALAHPELAAHIFWMLNSAIDRLAPAIAARRGVEPDDLDALVSAHLVVDVTQVAIRRWMDTEGRDDPADTIAVANEILRSQLDR